jgi:hypothetical protein
MAVNPNPVVLGACPDDAPAPIVIVCGLADETATLSCSKNPPAPPPPAPPWPPPAPPPATNNTSQLYSLTVNEVQPYAFAAAAPNDPNIGICILLCYYAN